jgi:hypothetical protein
MRTASMASRMCRNNWEGLVMSVAFETVILRSPRLRKAEVPSDMKNFDFPTAAPSSTDTPQDVADSLSVTVDEITAEQAAKLAEEDAVIVPRVSCRLISR